MKISIRSLAFIFAGLIIIIAVFLFTRHNLVEASRKDGVKFEDWTVNCAKEEEKSESLSLCLLSQQINVTQDDKPQPLAVYRIGYFGPKKELKMIQTIPLGVKIEPGTSIVSSKNLIAPGKFTVCTQLGCQAVADISEADLKTILKNIENTVVFMNIDAKTIALPISTKGLEAGLKFIK